MTDANLLKKMLSELAQMEIKLEEERLMSTSSPATITSLNLEFMKKQSECREMIRGGVELNTDELMQLARATLAHSQNPRYVDVPAIVRNTAATYEEQLRSAEITIQDLRTETKELRKSFEQHRATANALLAINHATGVPRSPRPEQDIADHLGGVREEVSQRRLIAEFKCLFGMAVLEKARSQEQRDQQFDLVLYLDQISKAGLHDFVFYEIQSAVDPRSLRGERYQRLLTIYKELRAKSVKLANDVIELLKGAQLLSRAKEFYDRWDSELPQFDRTYSHIFVCSDVHLGMQSSDSKAFEQALSLCNRGDTLLLLGDILDFWISEGDGEIAEGHFFETWIWLFERLRVLRGRGVEICYVPGNHDPFVFTLYSAEATEWGADLRQRAPFLRRLEAEVSAKFPLTQLASIEYPFFYREIAGGKWLFTHGHIHEWWWSLLGADNAVEESPAFTLLKREIPWGFAWLSSVASEMAYKYASRLRTGYKFFIDATHPRRWLGDIGMLITHDALKASEVASQLRMRDWSAIHLKIEDAFKLYCAMTDDDTAIRQRVRKGLEELEKWRSGEDLQRARDRTAAWIQNYPSASNFKIQRASVHSDNLRREHNPLRDFDGFNNFVCGHFHQSLGPSGYKPILVDVGAMYAGVVTMIQINESTGWIGRPAGIVANS